MSQALSAEKLKSKTPPELRDILDRQDRLLSKTNFIRSLPDRGRKVEEFAVMLRRVLDERAAVSEVTRLTENMSLAEHPLPALERVKGDFKFSTPDITQSSINHTKPDFNGAEFERDYLRGLVNLQQKDVVYMRTEDDDTPSPVMKQSKVNCGGPIVSNNDGIVEHPHGTSRFRPNRDLKISDIRQLPGEFFPQPDNRVNRENITEVDGTSEGPRTSLGRPIKHTSPLFHEPVYVYGETKPITIQESAKLQVGQRQTLERVQAAHAAERLAERLAHRTDWSGETVLSQPETVPTESRYRERQPDIDSDDDDSNDGSDTEGKMSRHSDSC